MKIKNISVYIVASLVATISITEFIRPTILERINLEQIKTTKNSEQITTKAISLLLGNGEIIRSSQIKFPLVGEKYALIHNEEHALSKAIYFGDTDDILELSIGQFKLSGIPGQNKPILLAGHNGTHFRLLPNLEIGNQVNIDTSYGKYVYEIFKTEIINELDFDDSLLDLDEELLIMYTCYPFNAIKTNQRYFVYAKKISGPYIEEEGKWSD